MKERYTCPPGHADGRRLVMTRKETISLGDLISLFYEEFLALYGDEEIASVAAAATINELLDDRGRFASAGDAAA